MITSHKLSLLCPTRQRPSFAVRLVESVEQTTSLPHLLEILFYIDSDDPTLDEYEKRLTNRSSPLGVISVELIIGPPISVSKSWDILAERANGDVFLMANDDQVYRTPFWDVRLNEELAKFPDDIYCIYFDDGIWTEGQHCAFPIVSRKWVDTLGYFSPGIFKFFRNDTWIFDLAQRIGRAHFVKDVLTEHLHPIVNKSVPDALYRKNQEYYNVDTQIWDASENQRIQDAEKLRKAMKWGLT